MTGDVQRLREFLIFLFAWAMMAAGILMAGALTFEGLRFLAGWLFWRQGFHGQVVLVVGGPLLLFVETGPEPGWRRYLLQAWKNLIQRRNDWP